MREIVLDTETTGLDPAEGHRIVEIACFELYNHVPTGVTFQRYINPERDMPEEARTVHGLTAEFLADKPKFAEVAEEFVAFIGDAPLIIHNAEFDIRFINAEFARLNLPPIVSERAVDTLLLARRKFPGAQASLDALCRRFEIDTSVRVYHGALIDCSLLAQVYLELIGGRQPTLGLTAEAAGTVALSAIERMFRAPRPHEPSADELAAHQAMIGRLKNPVWLG